jgi:hypothetical protein
MPDGGCSHHGPPRARKVYGKEGGPTAGRVRHDYQQMRGWGTCSCGFWSRAGTEAESRAAFADHTRAVRQARR